MTITLKTLRVDGVRKYWRGDVEITEEEFLRLHKLNWNAKK